MGIELVNGGNNNQAYPISTSATTDGTNTTIIGTFSNTPDTTFTLEFFANTVPNPSGYGEGQQYLGAWTVSTDDSGNANFTAVFAAGDTTGLCISATATDPGHNTSSFSLDVTVTGPDVPGLPGPRPTAGNGSADSVPVMASPTFTDQSYETRLHDQVFAYAPASAVPGTVAATDFGAIGQADLLTEDSLVAPIHFDWQ